jgi:proline iminopeptidase
MVLIALILFFLFPSQPAEEGYKQINGVRLYYRIVGTGEPLIMVHGGPGSNMLHLLPYCDTLARSFKLIYYDQRGCGKSTALQEWQTATWKDHVEDLEELRRVFGLETMNLFGHSWGGGLVMLYAKTYPRRVKRLIISNSMPAYEGDWMGEKAAIERERERRFRVRERLQELEQSGLRAENPALYYRRFREIASWRIFADTSDAAKTVYGIEPCPLVNHSTWESLKGYDFRDDLRKFAMPVLVIHGEDDIIPLKYAYEIHALIPRSRLVVTKKGHQPYIEDPATYFQAITDFLHSSAKVN